MSDHRQLGPNRIVIERDLLTISEQSKWADEEVDELLSIFEEILSKEGRLFVITVATGTVNVSPVARRRIAQWFDQHEIAAAAAIARSMVGRAVMSLVIGAMNLLGRRRFNVRFCATIDEAYKLIAEERIRLYGAHT